MTALFFHVIERNVFAYRRLWGIFLTGFAEPLLYLGSIGIGVGALVGTVTGPGGQTVPYDQFVAPGLLAAAAMNGAAFDTTFNFFFKYKYAGTFNAMLATPLGPVDVAMGELGWALMRGTIYAGAFLVFMVLLGLVSSPWAILCLPTAMLIGFAFGGAGMAATTYMRSFVDFDYVNMVLLPLFLFSGTFFPLSQYPTVLQWIVRCTPLYQGVALERAFAFGELSWALAGHVGYLAVMGIVGVRIAGRRLALLLQP
jgi:lipooligosaccharide transport system permease protein